MNKKKILIGKVSTSELAKKFGTPLYVYDKNLIKERCRELKRNLPGVILYYACKANTNPEIVKLIFGEGFGIEAVSPGEIKVARKAGVPVSKLAFTCVSIDEDELVWVAKQGIRIRLDSLTQVERFGKHFPGREISVRLNQGIGAGHHAHVITGGPDSKFGIDVSQVGQLKKIADAYKLRITGLHQHIGSNILEASMFLKAMKALFDTAFLFPDLKKLDFGGGFGVPYRPAEKSLDIETLGRKMKTMISNFRRQYGRDVEMSFEPGRYLIAEAGYLLVQVNDIKRNPTKTFVGVNSGFNHLIRPAMYGSHHEILNMSNPGAKPEKVTIAGNICESGDVFAKNRMIANPKIGDILAIKNAGAYGYTMSSLYNLRPRPREIIVSGNKAKVIRK